MTDKQIWDYIYTKTGNEYGTAAIMGNFMAESSMVPTKTGGVKDGVTYTKNADNGTIDFVHDKKAYGLAQWCYWSRKEALLNYAKSAGESVGNTETQLGFMWKELQSYKTALNAVLNATNVRSASDVFMLRYEKPGNTSEYAKQKRADYGQKYYDTYSTKSSGQTDTTTSDDTPISDQVKCNKTVVANVNVNIRSGNSTKFAKLGAVSKGTKLEWVATAVNGWYAIMYKGQVAWISNEFTTLVS